MTIRLDVRCKDMVDIIDRLAQCFHWLNNKNVHMYFWRTELTIEKLEDAKNELEDRLVVAEDYMYEARRNGWLVKTEAKGWIRKGRGYISKACEVVEEYKKLMDDPTTTTTTTSVLLCPCEALSRRRALNSKAVLRLNDILEHTDAGKEYDAEDHGGMEAVATTEQTTGAGAIPSDDCEEAVATREQTGADGIPGDDCAMEERSPPVSQGLRNEFLAPSDIQKMKLSGLAKYHAFPRAESFARVPVMIRVNAPVYTRRSRAAIDLIMVLDVSKRMKDDSKLNQLKQACMFVILNLDKKDRLSIVTFGTKRIKRFELTKMSADGKTSANTFVHGLKACGDITEADEAMDHAYKILNDQQYGNPVRSILLLADGRNKTILEESLSRTKGVLLKRNKYPTYTFGFGPDHDPRPLYHLATCGYGTYSFVTEDKSIRDAMALCIGGLTSIVAQDVKITISSAREDVEILDIMSEGYYDLRRRRSGSISGFTIDVKDLCASEEKKFIVYVNVPREEASGGGGAAIFTAGTPKTKLLSVKAKYYCPLTRTDVSTDAMEVSMERPRKLRDRDGGISTEEVAGEVTRADMFNGVENAWRLISKYSNMKQRARSTQLENKLTKLKESIGSTEEARAARERWDDLVTDLENMKKNIFDIDEFLFTEPGLPYMLSWLSSHRWQRAATPGSSSKSRWFNFRTTRMQNMIDSVNITRQQRIDGQESRM